MPPGKLRIAMLSVHSCPVGVLGARDTGGMSVYIREMAQELGKQGHLVDVYTRVHDPADPQIVSLGENARLIHLRAGEDEEMNKLAVYSYLPDFACNLENFRKRAGVQYDLVYSHYWLSGWVGTYLQKWWGVPHVIMFHTLGAIKNAIGVGEDEPELRIETERELVQSCHRIIAPTEKEKNEIIRHYAAAPERISVIPCGVNLELFQPVDKKLARQKLGLTDEKVVLYIGRIEPLKGIGRLIEAMSHLGKEQQPRLLIVGGDEHSQSEIDELRALSRDFQIDDSVVFSGTVKQPELPCYYSAADVSVIPSYYESFGLTALESLACGTPVVATDVGAFRDIIHQGETGYMVTGDAPEQMAASIGLLLDRSGDDAGIALSIRESVSDYSWANVTEMFIRECCLVLADFSHLPV